MKKLFALIMVVAFVLSMSLPVFAKEKAETTFGTAVIDGKNTDGEWDNVPKYPLNKPKIPTGTKSDYFDAYFQVKYDGTSLYVFIEVSDETVSKKPGGVDVKQDRIQTYIDYSNKGSGNYKDPSLKQYQVALNRNGDFGYYDCIDYNLNDNFELKVISDNKGYTVEYKLDLKGITGETVTEDKEIGFDIQISDNNTNSDQRLCAYGWNDVLDQAWEDVSALGKLKLVAKKPDPTPTETPNETEEPEETPDATEEPEETATPEETEEPTQEPTEEPTNTNTPSATVKPIKEDSGSNTWIIVLIVVVVAAIIGAAVYFVKKRKQ